MRHRLRRALVGLCASGLTATSLAVVGVAVAPAADAAAPPGTPWTFGENAFGQLGNGTTTTRRTGAPVNGLNGVIDMHGGREHVVALKSDGTVWTWGSNVEGQQGRGTTANTLVPTQVTSLGTDNIAVETGHNHTVVLKSNGTVWTFGLNSDGQLGDGTTTLRRSPVQVSGITDAVGIAAGRDMSLRDPLQRPAVGLGPQRRGPARRRHHHPPSHAGPGRHLDQLRRRQDPHRRPRPRRRRARTTASVWAWGSNDYGQVGDGTITDRPLPVAIDINGATAGSARRSTRPRARTTPTPCGPTAPSRRGAATTAPSSATAPARKPDPSGQRARRAARHSAVPSASGPGATWATSRWPTAG